ncbi:4'-phosphopantetheinyl transferase superfamily protein [Streptomyces sp. BG9H]|uniref:4'-phosphopantetheinyl transferase superfamily protein n=1 Tax=Streptomyces anatolicus TaxID=2675858 RepID=A0ABS6YGB4_9ACTN|nr:4'-phosphopantetheinyl transferase superfamily protein [Streptomyces anatolicus]MBW5420451.1 4'-phosphopantetheinyl transferase superfamily protein [Streptomyces anatolicus]
MASLLAAVPVTVVETYGDPADAVLFPEEEAVVAKAVAKRRDEFTTVRHCARAALHLIGVPPAPILPGQRGAPRWPDGVVGSMTHCAGYRAAVVARAGEVTSLGVDAEPGEPLRDPDVLTMIADESERAALADLGVRHPGTPWDRLLFSAKESVYKTWFPLTGRWLGFEDARVRLDPDGTFTARLLVEGPVVEGVELKVFSGQWIVRDGIAATAIVLPITPADQPSAVHA